MSRMAIPSSPLLAPPGDSAIGPYWSGAARGELVLPRCGACRTFRQPTLRACPACGSRATEWTGVTSPPTLYSWVIVRRTWLHDVEVPYCVAVAEFPEGVRLPGNLVFDEEREHPRAGVGLVLMFHEHAGYATPMFVLESSSVVRERT